MSVGPAELIGTDLEESSVNGQLEYTYVERYQVICTDVSDGSIAVLGATGLPGPRSAKLVPSTGVYVWCIRRSPRRTNDREARLRWEVTCTYSNMTGRFERDEQGNPVEDITDAAPSVEFQYQEAWAPITDAKYIETVDENGNYVVPPAGNQWLPFAPWTSIVNSAGDRIERERRITEQIVIRRKVFSDWNAAWDDAVSRSVVNEDEVTLTQSDQFGVRLSRTFQPRTLRLDDLSKNDVWRNGRLYFNVGFVMSYNQNTWDHFETDAGIRAKLFVGQYKADGTQFTQPDLDKYKNQDWLGDDSLFHLKEYDDTGASIGLISEPVLFNGYGHKVPYARPGFISGTDGKSFRLRFRVYPETSFAALGIV